MSSDSSGIEKICIGKNIAGSEQARSYRVIEENVYLCFPQSDPCCLRHQGRKHKVYVKKTSLLKLHLNSYSMVVEKSMRSV